MCRPEIEQKVPCDLQVLCGKTNCATHIPQFYYSKRTQALDTGKHMFSYRVIQISVDCIVSCRASFEALVREH